jgi:hypothetical protein
MRRNKPLIELGEVFMNTANIGVRRPRLSISCGKIALLLAVFMHGGVVADERLDHFENKIRPVLVKHCLECHGDNPSDLGGGLSLISRDAILAGGDTGPAVVPEEAEASLLLQAIRYSGSVEMPPAGRLPDAIVKDFETWINQGAVDPRETPIANLPAATKSQSTVANVDHWAFQPLRRSSESATDATSLIDRHIDRALSVRGLTRSAPASYTTMLRRLHYDLTGLPPAADVIAGFANDPSEKAYQALVDRLLASDDFGRHWGRHWLDVARYADSNGSDFNATFHHAWRYRDYVIDSFNADKPYDQFVIEQIAGDLLPAKDDHHRVPQLVATGFLMLGPKMLSERDKMKLQMDVVDDQIDTIGRAMMGLTLGCARCHDHKFDPVPTSDYYALAGIFRSTDVLQGEIQKYVSDWIETPLPTDTDHANAVANYAAKEKELIAAVQKAEARLKAAKASKSTDDSGIVVDDASAKRTGNWVESVYSSPFIGTGYIHDDNRNKGEAKVAFVKRLQAGRYRLSVAYTAQANRSRSTKVHWSSVDKQGASKSQTIVLDQTKVPEQSPWRSLIDVGVELDQEVSVAFSNEGTDGYVIVDAIRFEPIDDAGKVIKRAELATNKQDISPTVDDVAVAIATAKEEVLTLRESLVRLRESQPAPLPMAMAVRDSRNIGDTFVCVRGEVALRGETVARGFLRVCQPNANDSEESTVTTVSMPSDQSGRLQLAQWICDPDHPLTARVIVNRVWMHLMGEGIVRSVDNFGVLGERPTHPELLDELAIEFLRDGWSMKRLIRRIVLSETYRQSTDFNAEAADKDVENRLLWRMNRKRLPAESLRDTLLLAAKQLDGTPSISPVASYGTLVSENVADPKVTKAAESNRRSVYLPVIRGQVNELLAAFDFADPDLLVGRRERTTVPSQALVMLNHPWIRDKSAATATDILADSATVTERIRDAFVRLYCRLPNDEEVQLMSEFIASFDDPSISPAVLEREAFTELVNAMIGSSEFRLLD